MRLFKKFSYSLVVLGVFNLLFLPLVHFHPEDTHTHPGKLESHHHEGHFHSLELESVAHWVKEHPNNPEEDLPLHHSHSSTEHDSDNVEYTTLTLSTFEKKPTPVSIDLELISAFIPENSSDNFILRPPVFLSRGFLFDLSTPKRGPPTSI